ncbi:MAG: hypothetical protein AVDCRST_MAG89-1570, partial [uncultured Gemmatimonadetes bacterium]
VPHLHLLLRRAGREPGAGGVPRGAARGVR